MRKTGFWISIFMIVSVLTGLYLPRLTFAWQEHNSGSQIEECTAQNVGLTYSNDIIDSLRLFSEGYRMLNVSGKAIHTEEEIEEIAVDLLYQLRDYNIYFVDEIESIIFSDVQNFLIFPMDTESSYSAIIWELGIKDETGDEKLHLYFDDASGKMISFLWRFPALAEKTEQSTYTVNGLQEQTFYDTWGNVDMLLENGISYFFWEYYDLDSATDSLFGEEQDTYLEFTFIEEKYGITTVPVWIYPDFFVFNPSQAQMEK